MQPHRPEVGAPTTPSESNRTIFCRSGAGAPRGDWRANITQATGSNAMEEAVGIRWHRLITRLAGSGFPDAVVRLEDEGPRLAMVFRALSGDPGLAIKASTERSLNTWRPLAHRLAGTGRRHTLAWREAEALRVPHSLEVFPEQAMNRDLYLWLAAMATS